MKNAFAVTIPIAAALMCGCGGPDLADPVDPDRARGTLQDVLESWQKGATPESWREKSPEVVVQDMDWNGGAKLHSYEFLGPGEALDANLHAPVRLTLVDPQGRRQEKTVTYIIGTSPVLTVFREVP
ncbi:MAG: hypothetical protein KY476_14530 [Planctomycetes bacterium]|nr:hypothetical protein [Planctomycetota bacterium]